MSFRLSAALGAALSMAATAALFAADMSSASEAAAPVTISEQFRTSPEVPATAPRPVIFAAPREIVQSTTSTAAPAATPDFSDSAQAATSLAALVEAHGAPEDVDGDMKCLAGAVFFESRSESLEGQLAVARVIINRARSGRFAETLCGVVTQRGQFSFVRGGAIPSVPQASQDWREAVAIAQIAMDDSWDSRAEGALFFHARRVAPGWGKAKLAAIDNHVFYR